MVQLDIADLKFEIVSTESFEFNRLTDFRIFHRGEPDIKVFIDSFKNLSPPQNSEVFLDEIIKWSRDKNGNNRFYIYICNEKTGDINSILSTDNNWSNFSLRYKKYTHIMEDAFAGTLGEIAFRNAILFHKGIVMHASAINWDNKGIMFSAPSGTGKTTQANLWRKYMGAEILNGDRPAVRVLENKAMVYGTPWSGSVPEFTNSNAPLSAIIMLEQSPTNSIRELKKEEVLLYLMPRCFLPYHDKRLMDIAIENLGRIITSTPVYLLKCRPDKEAVELVYQCIK